MEDIHRVLVGLRIGVETVKVVEVRVNNTEILIEVVGRQKRKVLQRQGIILTREEKIITEEETVRIFERAVRRIIVCIN